MDWIEWMWKVDVDVESGKWRVARFRISHIHNTALWVFYLETQYNSQCQPTVVILSTSELQIEVDVVNSE